MSTCAKCGRPLRKVRRHPNAKVQQALATMARTCVYCSAVEYLAGGFEPKLLSELSAEEQQAARDEAIELREQLLSKRRGRARARQARLAG